MKETVDFSKLISDAISGDSSAFGELYKLSLKTAYHTASLLLKNTDDVEDVLQNAYIKAYQKLPELKNPESFEGWIKTIVENECKNYIKKEKKIHAPIIFFKNKTEEYSEEWKQPVPQEYMEREELRKSVSEIIDSLSPEIRACIVLFHYEDKNLNEISEILDIPLGTVKSRLHNGRKQVEKEFNKLRKKDPTLYSVGAIPVILALLSYHAKNIVVPAAISETVIASVAGTASAAGAVSSASGAAASTVAATSSAAATGGAAATTAASIAVKVTAVAVAGTVAAGGTVAVKNHIDNKAETSTASSFSSTVVPETCTTSETITEFISETELTTLITTLLSSISRKASTSQIKTTPDISTPQITTTAVKETVTETTTETTATTTSKPSTTKQTTTSRPSTTLLSTAPTTTESTTEETTITTTRRRTTTEKENTTEKSTTSTKHSTTEATTEKQTTASSESNYGTSGGVITEYTGTDSDVSIPSSVGSETVTAIGSGAFAGNTEIQSVRLPSTVTQIGQEAFAECTSLSSVSLPSSLEQIGIGAFYGCSSLSSVSIPDGTKTISDEAFAQCTTLSTVTIPSSITSISDDAFDGCDSLTIRCEVGSAAHYFAVANNINFSLI